VNRAHRARQLRSAPIRPEAADSRHGRPSSVWLRSCAAQQLGSAWARSGPTPPPAARYDPGTDGEI